MSTPDQRPRVDGANSTLARGGEAAEQLIRKSVVAAINDLAKECIAKDAEILATGTGAVPGIYTNIMPQTLIR
jgi:hypothetical protein